MAQPQRFGLWIAAGLANALAARSALGELQNLHPGADWVLFGPRESLFLFEMDERVPAYIPLRALEPRRPAQSRLSYFFEKRAQFKKLRGLGLDLCFGVAVLQADSASNHESAMQFQHTLRMLAVKGELLHRPGTDFDAIARPQLQAGSQALAFATQLYRKAPPNQPKQVVLLSAIEAQGLSLEVQVKRLGQIALADQAVHSIKAVVVNRGDRLIVRHSSQVCPDCLQLDLAQAMGLIAYADRVISCSETITRICAEMGRSDRLLLDKTHT